VVDTDRKTDEELVEEAQAAPEGDLRAFEALVGRHQEWVVSNCRYITRAPDEAPDLAQEVLVKAFYGLVGFEGRSKFRTWLGRIKLNHCLNFKRKEWGATFVSLDDPEEPFDRMVSVEPNPERDLETSLARERIRAVLDSMVDTLRIPLILRDHDGFSYQEIADHLGIGLSAVKMRIKRAREEFRARFESPEDEFRTAHEKSPGGSDEWTTKESTA
jgi:RNA polymerase sigma-70 factor (ECF subfamily)